MKRTHYDVLEVSPRASPEAIKGAYKFLLQKWHPDKNPGQQAQAEQIARELNDAYEVLSDPERRRAYDAILAVRAGQESARPAAVERAARAYGETSAPPGGGYAARAAHSYKVVQDAAERARRSRAKSSSSSTFWTIALAVALVTAYFAANPNLLKRYLGGRSPPAVTRQHDAGRDPYAEYWVELEAVRRAHPELDPASTYYDMSRAQGFMARIGQYMDRGMSPTDALHAAVKDTY
ncbi:MAG: J domain-containing protein [Nevskia sp.]|nr:J domain-containing protein [Nevskia sp.]